LEVTFDPVGQVAGRHSLLQWTTEGHSYGPLLSAVPTYLCRIRTDQIWRYINFPCLLNLPRSYPIDAEHSSDILISFPFKSVKLLHPSLS
jgi:hypothetical protein